MFVYMRERSEVSCQLLIKPAGPVRSALLPDSHCILLLFSEMSVIVAVLLVFCTLHVQGASVPAKIQDASLEVPQEDVVQKLADFFSAPKIASNCLCGNYTCGCCSRIIEKQIHLNSTICANATYLKQDYGFSLTVTFNNFTVFNETMSLRNPPPICIGAPYVEDWADVCVHIYDIQASRAHLHACVQVEVDLRHIRLAKYKLGCFDMEGSELEKAIQRLENETL